MILKGKCLLTAAERILSKKCSNSLNRTQIICDDRFSLIPVSLWYLCLRLAEERQEAVEQRLQQPAAEDKRQKMLDSLSKAGVDNFTMKAAVPGTEVPGHKV